MNQRSTFEAPGGWPKLHFEGGWTERDAYEAEARGCRGHVSVELKNGIIHPVYFYDPVRLQQDLESRIGEGEPCLAEKNMVILQSVTLENMLKAVAGLEKEGFFENDKS